MFKWDLNLIEIHSDQISAPAKLLRCLREDARLGRRIETFIFLRNMEDSPQIGMRNIALLV